MIAYPNAHYPPDAEALALADVVIGALDELARRCGEPGDRLKPRHALGTLGR